MVQNHAGGQDSVAGDHRRGPNGQAEHQYQLYRPSRPGLSLRGAAWYQREIIIPQEWANRTITLLLERTKNSRVWVDEHFFGEQDSLAAPHVYEISSVRPLIGRLRQASIA